MAKRHVMADASHELRIPVTTMRTVASGGLQQEHRDTLAIDGQDVVTVRVGQSGRVSVELDGTD